jgi:hypothetical protein
MAKKRRRKSAFVPRVLVPAAAAMSVVPAIAISSCGNGSSSTGPSVAITGYGVAATGWGVAYPAYEAGPDGTEDANDAQPPEAGSG